MSDIYYNSPVTLDGYTASDDEYFIYIYIIKYELFVAKDIILQDMYDII